MSLISFRSNDRVLATKKTAQQLHNSLRAQRFEVANLKSDGKFKRARKEN